LLPWRESSMRFVLLTASIALCCHPISLSSSSPSLAQLRYGPFMIGRIALSLPCSHTDTRSCTRTLSVSFSVGCPRSIKLYSTYDMNLYLYVHICMNTCIYICMYVYACNICDDVHIRILQNTCERFFLNCFPIFIYMCICTHMHNAYGNCAYVAACQHSRFH